MKQTLRFGLMILLTLSLAACGDISFSTASISNADLAMDENGNEGTTIFGPDDTFYLLVESANAPENTMIKAEWVAVAVENVAENTVIDNEEQTGPSDLYTFDLLNENQWPVGTYRVDIFINDDLDRSIEFQVSDGLAEGGVFAGVGGNSAESESDDALAPTSTPLAVTDTESDSDSDSGEEGITAETGAETETGTSVEISDSATEEPPSGQIDNLDDVIQGVIQIEAQGSFVDPQFGNVNNAAGRGSGFIINDSGIAVTNNHVVTGAALLRVWVGGEAEPRNARILGVSECADLAVIDIEGDGYSYLPWYEGEISVGTDVYAAGFPLGDPEFTLTRGIVAKAEANGDAPWASNEAIIEHDATINPGNSGGPLVTTNGQVVAVNYAGSSETNQYFAISRDEALTVIETLEAGQDFLSLGINGRAVNNGEGLSGIWVASVKSGSPADNAGIQGGDIITRLENLVLATDGTMADYCDILRTHSPEDVLSVEVLRVSTEEILEGQINGRELEQTFSFADEVEMAMPEPSGGDGAQTSYTEFVEITDNTNSIVISVPAAWSDIEGAEWTDPDNNDSLIGPAVSASPDLDAFSSGWTTPGVFFGVELNPSAGVIDTLNANDFSEVCTLDQRSDYDDGLFTGGFDLWVDCGGIGTVFVQLIVQPNGGNELIHLQYVIRSEADLNALDQILDSFNFTN